MIKYIVTFKSTKKYDPDIERTVVITAHDLLAAQSSFYKRFKEVEVLSIEEVETDK